MSPKSMGEMTSREIHEAIESGMAEVARRLESGEIDGSGRYYSDAELAAGAATGRSPQSSQAVTEDAVICTKHVSAA